MERANGVCEPRLSPSCFQQPRYPETDGLAWNPPDSDREDCAKIANLVKDLEGVERICEAIMKQVLSRGAEETIVSNESEGSLEVKARMSSPLKPQSDLEEGQMKPLEHTPPTDIIDLTSEDSCGEEPDLNPELVRATERISEATVSEPSPGGVKTAPEKTIRDLMILSDDDDDDKVDEVEIMAPLPAAPLPWIGKSPIGSSVQSEDPLHDVWSYMDKALKQAGTDQGAVLPPQVNSDVLLKGKRKDDTSGDFHTRGEHFNYPSVRLPDQENIGMPTVSPTEPRVKRARGRPRKDSTPDCRTGDTNSPVTQPPPHTATGKGVEHLGSNVGFEAQLDVSTREIQQSGNRDDAVDASVEPQVNLWSKSEGHRQGHGKVAVARAGRQKVKVGRKRRKIRGKGGTNGGRNVKNKDGKIDEDEDEDEDESSQTEKPSRGVEEEDLIKQFLIRQRQDEEVDYEPHHRSTIRFGEGENADSDSDLDTLFKDMDIADGRFQELDRLDEVVGCEHKNFDYDESMGYYCEDCGCVDLDLPTITKKKQTKDVCQHPNIYFDDATGYFCYNCGKTRDIEKMLLISDDLKRARKHLSKGQQHQTAQEEQQFQLQLCSRSNDLDLATEPLHLHPSLEKRLHSHQKAGFKFLTENLLGVNQNNESVGCVIAHAPGTGKTCLIISFIQSYLAMFEKGRPLILAPKIMLHSWKKEFEIWKIQDVPIHELSTEPVNGRDTALGDGRSDDEEEEEEFKMSTQARLSRKLSRAKTLRKWQGERSVLLMSYTLYVLLVGNGTKEGVHPDSLDAQISRILTSVPNLVIMDEGHLARNNKTNVSDALLAMETKRRVLLSGTLFQNNFRELFTLLKLCRDDFMLSHDDYGNRIVQMAGGYESLKKKSTKDLMQIELKIFSEEIGDKLESYAKSGENYGTDEIEEIVTKLQSLTKRFVDWYEGDILNTLPGLEEYSVGLNLTKLQLRCVQRLPSLRSDHKHGHMYRMKMLQKLCIHPSLAGPTDSDILEHPSESSDPHDGVKVTFVLELISLCRRSNEKILIFCTTLAPFCYFEKVLGDKFGWTKDKEILRLDGKMQESDRQVVIKAFNEVDSRHRILLASTKACKEGITLIGASRVVILDNPENPSVVRQAVSRAFRIGQTRKVYVYRLVANNKEEEAVNLKSVNKERLSQVLSDPRNTLQTSEQFLRLETKETIEDGMLQQMMSGYQKQIFNSVYRYNASG